MVVEYGSILGLDRVPGYVFLFLDK